MEIQTNTSEVTINTDTTVEIDSKLPEASVEVTKSITAEVQPENYVLTSGGIYTGNLTGQIPTWILDAVNQQLTTGDGNITSVLDDMRILLDDLQLGVNQAISQIENTNTSLSTLETSLSSRINENSADILDVYATRVTATEAQAIATTAIGATFNGNVDAYIGNLASAYTAPGSATATNISTLQASSNDQAVRIDTLDNVTITPEGWTLGASKLATTSDNSIVGWQFSNGSNEFSEFNVFADHFKVSSGTTGLAPFRVDTVEGKVYFNAEVEFEGLGINGGSTTIDGGKIRTNTINADRIIAGTSMMAPLINGGTINGGTINGVQITGSVIRGSWIDYVTVGALTNWQHYLLADVPVAYKANFAHDNVTGALVVDSEGYVRLPTTTNASSAASTFSVSRSADGTSTLAPATLDLYTYDTYTVSTNSRFIKQSPRVRVSVAAPATEIFHASIYAYYHGVAATSGSCIIFGTLIEWDLRFQLNTSSPLTVKVAGVTYSPAFTQDATSFTYSVLLGGSIPGTLTCSSSGVYGHVWRNAIITINNFTSEITVPSGAIHKVHSGSAYAVHDDTSSYNSLAQATITFPYTEEL